VVEEFASVFDGPRYVERLKRLWEETDEDSQQEFLVAEFDDEELDELLKELRRKQPVGLTTEEECLLALLTQMAETLSLGDSLKGLPKAVETPSNL
jgi:hypothetical protein